MGTQPAFNTVFGSLAQYTKGSIELVTGKKSHYAFSNIFEVAAKSAPYEKIVVGLNLGYVIEAIRAEGTSPGSPAPTTNSSSPLTAAFASTFSSSTRQRLKATAPSWLANCLKVGRWATCCSIAAIRRCCRPAVLTALKRAFPACCCSKPCRAPSASRSGLTSA